MLSVRTVDTHVAAILDKLDARTRRDAADPGQGARAAGPAALTYSRQIVYEVSDQLLPGGWPSGSMYAVAP